MRHALTTRLWHWLNLICVATLLMSGLNISNAHKRLYWGDQGFDPSQAWLHVPAFPGWMTIPDYYNLAAARSWHLLAAWPFALALLLVWIAMLLNSHFVRDVATNLKEWRWNAIKADIISHLKFEFDHEGGYNFLQKLAYGAVYGVFLPMMIFSGMAISPGIEPAVPWLGDLMGGRQSARSLHFIFAMLTFGFFLVHISLILVTGPIRQIRGMITGERT